MWESIKETVKTVVSALLIAGVFRTLLFQPFWIPSGSMKETLLVGDFLFVNKMAYGYSYASCPSIVIPAVGIDISAENFCGVFKGNNERFMGNPNVVMSLCSAILLPAAISLNASLVCPVIPCRWLVAKLF